MVSRKDRQDTGQLARRILDAVERGELEADSPAARRLLRRLEGAAAAWDAEATARTDPTGRQVKLTTP